MINWVKKRVEERTSWDGGMLIVLGVIVLIAGPFAKIAAYGAIAYGIWTIWKSEWVVVLEKEVKKIYSFYQWQYFVQYLVSYRY